MDEQDGAVLSTRVTPTRFSRSCRQNRKYSQPRHISNPSEQINHPTWSGYGDYNIGHLSTFTEASGDYTQPTYGRLLHPVPRKTPGLAWEAILTLLPYRCFK